MAIRPLLIDKRSPFVGEACAICKEPFSPGEEIVVCPEDATRHHVPCWVANENHCAAYGCTGHGRLVRQRRFVEEEDGEEESEVIQGRVVRERDSKVRTLPTSSVSCAQSCLLLAIAVSIIIFALSCFGLWALFDYIAVEHFGWHYRPPLTEWHTVLSTVSSAGFLLSSLLT